jgi:hypothetical protein
MNSHSVERVVGLLTPLGSYEEPLSRRPVSGMALREFLSRHWTAIPDLAVEERMLVARGPHAFLEWRARGVHASGKPIVFEGVTVFEIGEENRARVRSYYDANVFLEFLPRKDVP